MHLKLPFKLTLEGNLEHVEDSAFFAALSAGFYNKQDPNAVLNWVESTTNKVLDRLRIQKSDERESDDMSVVLEAIVYFLICYSVVLQEGYPVGNTKRVLTMLEKVVNSFVETADTLYVPYILREANRQPHADWRYLSYRTLLALKTIGTLSEVKSHTGYTVDLTPLYALDPLTKKDWWDFWAQKLNARLIPFDILVKCTENLHPLALSLEARNPRIESGVLRISRNITRLWTDHTGDDRSPAARLASWLKCSQLDYNVEEVFAVVPLKLTRACVREIIELSPGEDLVVLAEELGREYNRFATGVFHHFAREASLKLNDEEPWHAVVRGIAAAWRKAAQTVEDAIKRGVKPFWSMSDVIPGSSDFWNVAPLLSITLVNTGEEGLRKLTEAAARLVVLRKEIDNEFGEEAGNDLHVLLSTPAVLTATAAAMANMPVPGELACVQQIMSSMYGFTETERNKLRQGGVNDIGLCL